MLVLSRKIDEKIHIGHNITITVTHIDRNKVRLGIEAPDKVRILRGELAEWQDETESFGEEADALSDDTDPLPIVVSGPS